MSTGNEVDLPVYLSQAEVGRRLGVGRAAVVNYLTRYPGEYPRPVGYLADPRATNGLAPVWSERQMGEWFRFRLERLDPGSARTLLALGEQARVQGWGSLEDLLRSVTKPEDDPGSC